MVNDNENNSQDMEQAAEVVESLADLTIEKGGEGIYIPAAAFGMAVKFLKSKGLIDEFGDSLAQDEALIVSVSDVVAYKLGALGLQEFLEEK